MSRVTSVTIVRTNKTATTTLRTIVEKFTKLTIMCVINVGTTNQVLINIHSILETHIVKTVSVACVIIQQQTKKTVKYIL